MEGGHGTAETFRVIAAAAAESFEGEPTYLRPVLRWMRL